MASKTKRKVVLVIVEGSSDKTALELVLSRTFAPLDSTVTMVFVRGDITSDKNIHPANIVNRVTDVVKEYAQNNGKLHASDFLQVIQITDTDGTYIPQGSVVKVAGITPDPFYTLTNIQTANLLGTVRRNTRKGNNINKLVSQNTVWRTIPYKLYYLSCNMEHAFHNQNNLDDEQKKALARQFQRTYGRNVPSFYALLQSLLPPLPCQDYKTSWDYIRQGLHSLERCSNLYLALPANASQSGGVNAPQSGSSNASQSGGATNDDANAPQDAGDATE
ncbi:MAG: hypothetical protein IJR72_05235 [Oscillospiraceae bacterium]|nr:hypothetical protein [Oscillospiraceae bacterium]